MNTIASLLDPATQARLQNVIADLKMDAPARGTIEEAARVTPRKESSVLTALNEIPFVIVKAAIDPNPPRTLTARDAIDIDPESEALIDTQCVDCEAPVLIDPKVPEGVNPETPRVPICAKCAKIRARFAAISEQRNVETIRRSTVIKHQPRTTDGINHPVVTTTKENPMIDFDNMPDAELGALIKEQMRSKAAEALKPKRKKAKKAQAEKTAEGVKGVKAEQKRRKGHILPAFMVGTTLEVPALDLSDVSNLDECPNTTMRAPYNKARFRLEKAAPLASPSACEEDASLTPTTYRVLAAEHVRLMSVAATHNEAKAEPKPKAKKAKATVNVVAAIDPNTEAKVTALSKLMGISEQQARLIVAGA